MCEGCGFASTAGCFREEQPVERCGLHVRCWMPKNRCGCWFNGEKSRKCCVYRGRHFFRMDHRGLLRPCGTHRYLEVLSMGASEQVSRLPARVSHSQTCSTVSSTSAKCSDNIRLCAPSYYSFSPFLSLSRARVYCNRRPTSIECTRVCSSSSLRASKSFSSMFSTSASICHSSQPQQHEKIYPPPSPSVHRDAESSSSPRASDRCRQQQR